MVALTGDADLVLIVRTGTRTFHHNTPRLAIHTEEAEIVKASFWFQTTKGPTVHQTLEVGNKFIESLQAFLAVHASMQESQFFSPPPDQKDK